MRKIASLTLALVLLATMAWAAGTTPAQLDNLLKQLQVQAKTASGGERTFKLGFRGTKPESFLVRAMPEQRVVYLAVLDVAKIPAAQLAKFQTLARLNYQITVGKLEWDPQSTEVRLSYTFAGEQPVDFPSFKAVVQTLLVAVETVRKELNK
ncbi:MAG: hypothetical protein P9L99_20505 [Candidatus Lernaella stagnicola]|nr:hypothetical protein [Candidatus Lernaella stagnicola]